MPDPPPARSGVLLVRAWVEDGVLRARVIGRPPAGPVQVETAAVGVARVLELVRAWLEALEPPPKPGPPGPGRP